MGCVRENLNIKQPPASREHVRETPHIKKPAQDVLQEKLPTLYNQHGTYKKNSPHYTASIGCVRETTNKKKLALKCKRNTPHKAASMGCVRETLHMKKLAQDV